jgi:hypothetical protein
LRNSSSWSPSGSHCRRICETPRQALYDTFVTFSQRANRRIRNACKTRPLIKINEARGANG